MDTFIPGRLSNRQTKLRAVAVLGLLTSLSFGAGFVQRLAPERLDGALWVSPDNSALLAVAEARPAPIYTEPAAAPAPVAEPVIEAVARPQPKPAEPVVLASVEPVEPPPVIAEAASFAVDASAEAPAVPTAEPEV